MTSESAVSLDTDGVETVAEADAPTETELKLRCAPEQIDRLIALPFLVDRRIGPVTISNDVSTYFDTADLALQDAGIVLRVRRSGDTIVQTIKTRAKGSGGAVPTRHEWEWSIDREHPDLALLDDVDATVAAAIGRARGGLHPIFCTEVTRTSWPIALEPAGTATVAIDRGEVRSGAVSEAISEIEIELGNGTTEAICRLAVDLVTLVPLGLGVESKSARGYRLAGARAPGAVKPRPVALSSGRATSAAFRDLAGACLAHLLENQACVERTEDAEGVHQMRLALRRLRALFALFEGLSDPVETAWIDGELRAVALVLGKARDLDVLATEILPAFGEVSAYATSAHSLINAIEPLRRDARSRARAELATAHYTRLVLLLGAWSEGGAWRRRVEGVKDGLFGHPIGRVAPLLLDRQRQAVKRLGRGLAEASQSDRHKLRKALKQLGYGAEFFMPLYDPEATDVYVSRLHKVLDRLGQLTDGAMALRLVHGLPPFGDLSHRGAVAEFEVWSERRAVSATAKLLENWQRFKRTEAFWSR